MFSWDSYEQYFIHYRWIFSRRYTRLSPVDWTTVTPCLLDYLHVTSHDYNLSRMLQHVFFGGISKFESVQLVLRDVLHWLPVVEYITFKVALLTYKVLHGLTPSYLTDMLVPVARKPALRRNRSADHGDLVVPRVQYTSYGDHSFSIAASRLWNTLSCELCSSSSVTTFHTNLKTYLFRTAYNISASKYLLSMMTVLLWSSPRC